LKKKEKIEKCFKKIKKVFEIFFLKKARFLFSLFLKVVSVRALARLERFIETISHQSSLQIDFVPVIKDRAKSI
jgi:hypothetical protein